MMDSVSVARIEADLRTLEGFYTRHTNSDTLSDSLGIGAARRWIFDQFQAISDSNGGRLQVGYFNFVATIQGITKEHRNVVAILPGTQPESTGRIFLVSGHMDSRNANSSDSLGFAPGANDDGTGTAVSLELARIMAPFDFDATLIFMTVTGEEQGLFGSTHYADSVQFWGWDVRGMMSNDMIGNIKGDSMVIDSMSVRCFSIGPSTSSSRQLTRYVKLKGEMYTYPWPLTVNLVLAQDRPGRGSDHIPFNDKGYAAGRFIEPIENLSNQHSMTDLVDSMSVNFNAQIARLNVAYFSSLGWSPAQPESVQVDDAGNGSDIFVSWTKNIEPDTAEYRVAVRSIGSAFYDTIYSAGATDQLTVSGLTEEDTFYISVSAVDTGGNEGLFSQEIIVVPRSIPFPPESLTLTPTWFSLDLQWSPNQELDIAGYNIYRSFTPDTGFVPIGFSLHPTSTFVDSNVAIHTWYYYRMTAVDTSFRVSAFSDEVKGRILTMDQGILLVDETRDGSGIPPSPTDAQVDSFYIELLTGYTFTDWDYNVDGAVALSDLGAYSTIIWHGDDLTNQRLYDNLAVLSQYLDQGGNLWLVGWRPVFALMNRQGSFPYSFTSGDFPYDYLRLTDSDEASAIDFTEATGQLGFSDLRVDSSKVPAAWGGNLPFINTTIPLDAEVIYTINMASGDTIFQDVPCGVRYLSGPFKSVFFGFPLYFMEKNDARLVAVDVLDDLGETIGVEEKSVISERYPVFRLYQNRPNPFNKLTAISYQLRAPSHTTLIIYDIAGRKVKTLVDRSQNPGLYKLPITGNQLPSSGVYFYRLNVDDVTLTRKLIYLR
jgi:hypothetical protein